MNFRPMPMHTAEGGAAAPAPAAAPSPAPAPASAPAPAPRMIDPDIYRRVVEAKQGLESQVGQQRDQIAELSEKAATVDTLAAQAREWQAKATEAEARFGRWQGIASALGTADSEAIAAVEWAHSRLPAEGRPEVGAWVQSIKAAPDTAPKVLAPWLTPAADAAAPAPAPAGAPAPAPAQPRPPARGVQPTPAPAALSADAVRAAREKGISTGDWSEFQALKKAGGFRVVDKPTATR
jgi:pyruvate dehydrogenase E2 component (dihydrolipoamide acetyltransferase)